MRKQRVASLVGCVFLSGLLSPALQAGQVLNSSATLAISSGAPADALKVAYTVTDNSGLYTYDYTISNPATDPGTAASFGVGFDATSATVVPGSVSSGGSMISGSGLDWVAVVAPGHSSATLSFESPDAPTMVNADANGTSPGPWASANPGSSQVPAPGNGAQPGIVPEPSAMALLALGVMLVPFRSRLAKPAQH
jgi:hypothetical protein